MNNTDTGKSTKDNQNEEHSSKNLNQSLYNHIIAQNICVHDNLSGCLSRGAECNSFVPLDERPIMETHCDGLLNCSYCVASEEIKDNVQAGDKVIVQYEGTHEIATVKETGELVGIKRQRLGLYGEIMPIAERIASEEDLQILQKNSAEEKKAEDSFRKKAHKYNLNMKLVGVHYQFDRNKLFFFYTADGRVDFRELAKDLAGEFKTRIELRQIGVRDEAKRVGGLGTCGREFCCSLFLGNFKRITTQLATEQNLAQSFSKLSGPCGKLKCCLSFENDKDHCEGCSHGEKEHS